MNKDDLIYQLKATSLSDLVCVNKVKTLNDIEKYTKLGYVVSKLDNLINFIQNNDLDINKIYYQKTIFPQLIYMDLENGLLLELNIYVNNGTFESICYSIDDIVTHIKSMENKSIDEKLLYTPEGYKIEFLLKILNKVDKKIRYETFIDVYSSVDFGFNSLTSKEILDIFGSKTQKKKQITINKMKELPDVVKVYRGMGSKSLKNGYSYSLNWDIARFFAYRLSSNVDSVQILEGYVNKSDVIEYITDRGEEELLILPDKVCNKRVYTYHSFDKYSIDINIYNHYKYLLESYLKSNQNVKILNRSEHDINHLLRVLILCQLLAEHYHLENKYKSILYLAAVFHDIGRINDDVDNVHGEYGYHELIKQAPMFESDILYYLMKNHCVDDEKIEKYKDSNVSMCLNILKDADALDRQRFGLKDLNSDYLRLQFSKKISFYSFRLLNVKL